MIPTLKKHVVRSTDKDRLSPHLKNWVQCHQYLMTLAAEDHDEIGKMIVLELATRRRTFLLYRLTARFNHARSLAFHREIAQHVAGKGRSLA
jgi:hypothetical protein